MQGRFARIAGAAMVGGAMASGPVLATDGDPLTAHLWNSRVLVIAAADAADPQVRAQRMALASVRNGARERSLVTVEAIGSGAQAAALRRRLQLPDGAFRAVLIGKDGGAKLSSAEPIPPQQLFATIDAMPMRRDEMRRR